MKIGLVDLDTSHPGSWLPILRALGHEVIGVIDHGDVHPAGYATRFAAEHGIPRVFASLAETAEAVDCAIVHSCNWDTHVARTRPFIDASKAVLMDKPLAGTVADLRQLEAWAARGARITGGSSVRWCAETGAWLAPFPGKEGGECREKGRSVLLKPTSRVPALPSRTHLSPLRELPFLPREGAGG